MVTNLLELIPWKFRDENSEEINKLNCIKFISELPILIDDSNLATISLLFVKKMEVLFRCIFGKNDEEDKLSFTKLEEIIKLFGVDSKREIVMPAYSILDEVVSNSKLMNLEVVWSDLRFIKLKLPITKYQLFDMCEILNSLFGVDKRQAWELRYENENFYLYCDKGYFEAAQLLLIEHLRQSGFDFKEHGKVFSSYPQVFAAICDENFRCIRNGGFLALLRWLGIECDLKLFPYFVNTKDFCFFIYNICGDDICEFINNRREDLTHSLLSLFAPTTFHRIILPSTIRSIEFILNEPIFEIQFSNLINALKLAHHQLLRGSPFAVLCDHVVVHDFYKILKSQKLRKEDVRNLFLGTRIAPDFRDDFYKQILRNVSCLGNNLLLDVPLEQLKLWNENLSDNNNCSLTHEVADYLLKFCYLVEKSSTGITLCHEESVPNYNSQVILMNKNIHFGVPFAESGELRIFVLPRPQQKFKKWGNFYKVVLSRRILSLSLTESEEVLTASDVIRKMEF